MYGKKIVLIQLPSPYLLVEKWIAPLNLYYLQAYLKKMGFKNVNVINLAGIEDYLRALPPDADYYGISAFTPQFHLACAVSDFIKKQFGGTVIAGGHHVTALPEESLAHSSIDIVVRGEGEHALLDIVSQKPRAQVAGISYKENSRIIHNPSRTPAADIDEFPFPDIDEINFQEYPGMILNKNAQKYEMSLLTSRGCPFDCAFCASKKFWDRKVRFFSAEYIIGVLDQLYYRGINAYRFEDDNFDLNKPRLKKILAHLRKRQSSWGCCMRSENVNHETMAEMKDSGLTDVALGIESASDKILKLINKKETLETHLRAIEIIKQYDIRIKAFIMSYLPGEDQNTVAETVRFLQEQPIDSYTVSVFVPFPGTDIWDHPERYGYIFDRNQCYENFAFLNNRTDKLSVADNAIQMRHYHEHLFNACPEKNTAVRSHQVAQNLDRLTSWKEIC